MSRIALAVLVSAALLAACAPLPPAPAGRRPPPRRRQPPPAVAGRLGQAQRQARRPGHPADPDERRPGGRALRRFPRPWLRRLASDAGARCWSCIARPAASTTQIHRLAAPMGELEQITDFAEPVFRASYEPLTGDSIVFERSTGGDEAAQIYRLDLAHAAGDRRLASRTCGTTWPAG